MSPPPCRFRHTDVLPPPGMKNITAPTVHADGHAVAIPVVGSTQWVVFAMSPFGGVPAAAFEFGSPDATGRRWESGGEGFGGAAHALIVTFEFPPVCAQ